MLEKPPQCRWDIPNSTAHKNQYRKTSSTIDRPFTMHLMLEYSASINWWVLEVFTAVWCFVMGSVIGSFLNVVIYRMPLGLSISKPKSRCPICETPISTRDNLPILGWLLLKGRCRNCQAPIPIRYPIVEVLVGVFFLLLYWSLVHSGGRFLPYRFPNREWGAYQIIMRRTWDLIALYVYYSYLFIVVLASAYIQFDRQTIPRRLLLWCFLFGILIGAFIPELHPVPAVISVQPDSVSVVLNEAILTKTTYHGSLHWGVEKQTLITLGCGLVYGMIVGFLFTWPFLLQREKSKCVFQPKTFFLLILIGLYLGWQQVITVGFLAAFCLACSELFSSKQSSEYYRLPASTFLAVTLALQMLLGKYLTILSHDMEYLTYLIFMGAQITAIPIFAGFAQHIYHNREFQETSQEPIPIDETSTIRS